MYSSVQSESDPTTALEIPRTVPEFDVFHSRASPILTRFSPQIWSHLKKQIVPPPFRFIVTIYEPRTLDYAKIYEKPPEALYHEHTREEERSAPACVKCKYGGFRDALRCRCKVDSPRVSVYKQASNQHRGPWKKGTARRCCSAERKLLLRRGVTRLQTRLC